MALGEVIAIIIACLTALGLIISWGKNNRESAEMRTQIETNLKNELKEIKSDLQHPEYGLSAIKKKVDAQTLYCARTSTSLKEKVLALEKNPSR